MTEKDDLEKQSSLTAPQRRIAFFLILGGFLFLALAFRSPYVGQWDSFDYITKMVSHEISDLAFGRPVFSGLLILLWEGAHRLGASLPQAAGIAQGMVLLFGILGLAAFYFCIKPVAGEGIALIGMTGLALTPMYVAYSGMVMTEIPSLACQMGSVAFLMYWLERPRWTGLIASALLFAVAVHMREQTLSAAAVFPFLILLNRRMSLGDRFQAVVVHAFLFLTAILSVVVYVGWIDPRYWHRIHYWFSVFRLRDQGLWQQLYFLGKFGLVNAAVALGITVATWRYWSRFLPARAIVCGGAILPLAALLTNSDLGIQPRYEFISIPAFIFAALAGGKMMMDSMRPAGRRIFLAGAIIAQLAFLGGGLWVLTGFNQVSNSRKARVEQLLTESPRDAAFIGGAYTPILEFYRESGIRPGWTVIRSGWEWRRSLLPQQIEGQLNAHHPVFFLRDENAWDYLKDELGDVNALRAQFDFEPKDPGMEEIRRR